MSKVFPLSRKGEIDVWGGERGGGEWELLRH